VKCKVAAPGSILEFFRR